MGYVLEFQEIDRTHVAVVGGKGAVLGELADRGHLRAAGIVVTTDAFQRMLAQAPSIDDRLARLSRLESQDREAIRALSAEIRRTVEGVAIPDDVALAITRALVWLGDQAPCAVRSSATAQDLPTASFAGQHDSYLHVVGTGAVLDHVTRCWASLISERAVTHRLRNWLGPPQGPDGRRRAADGRPAGCRNPVHSRPRHLQPEACLGGGSPRSR